MLHTTEHVRALHEERQRALQQQHQLVRLLAARRAHRRAERAACRARALSQEAAAQSALASTSLW
jgi:hypothetical protein